MNIEFDVESMSDSEYQQIKRDALTASHIEEKHVFSTINTKDCRFYTQMVLGIKEDFKSEEEFIQCVKDEHIPYLKDGVYDMEDYIVDTVGEIIRHMGLTSFMSYLDYSKFMERTVEDEPNSGFHRLNYIKVDLCRMLNAYAFCKRVREDDKNNNTKTYDIAIQASFLDRGRVSFVDWEHNGTDAIKEAYVMGIGLQIIYGSEIHNRVDDMRARSLWKKYIFQLYSEYLDRHTANNKTEE